MSWEIVTEIERIRELRGLCSDLETVQEVIDSLDDTDKEANWILHYLSTEAPTAQMLANKRNHIVALLEDKLNELKEQL